MSWPASIGVGVLTGLVAGFLAGWIANLAAGWYRMSSFEGASGYFVVAMALLGALGGLVLGIAVSRMLSGGTEPGALKALGLSHLVVLGVLGTVGAVSRLRADVPPRLDGEELLVALEIRWPEGQGPRDSVGDGEWSLRLGSSVRNTMRARMTGPFWREDARQEDGRWVVPGAVSLFTSRGRRTLDVLPDGIVDNGWLIPLPGRPGKAFLEWSAWLPKARDGEPPLPDGFRYRFRIVPVSRPIRTQVIGPFEVVTIAKGFNDVKYGDAPAIWIADAQFVVRFRGVPVPLTERFDAVAALGDTVPALLVQATTSGGEGPCHLLVAEGDSLRQQEIGICGSPIRGFPLTTDDGRYAQALATPYADGRLDRTTFAMPGQYLLREVVLDTRTLTARRLATNDQGRLIERIPPLGISPDGDSFVRLEWAEASSDEYALAVTHLGTGEQYRVPIDRAATRLVDLDAVTPQWVAHYYAWTRDPSGADRLEPRSGVVPLPYRGRLTREGSYREYRVAPAREGLRDAMVEFLVAEFGGRVVSAEPGAFAHQVEVAGAVVHLSWRGEDGHVGVWMDRGGDTSLVARIAERFDAALGTGRYDHLFGH